MIRRIAAEWHVPERVLVNEYELAREVGNDGRDEANSRQRSPHLPRA